jgi:hypothetical protein
MKTLKFSLLMLSVSIGISGYGQKPAVVQVTSFLARIPIPSSSASCFASCTTTKDPSNGAVTVKDTVPVFQSIQDDLMKIMQGDMSAAQASSMSNPTAPSPDQMAQMQQQAAQMQNMTPEQAMQMQKNKANNNQPGQTNIALMRKIGEAQTHLMQIQQLQNELQSKISALDKSGRDKVKLGAPCPDVKQGSGDIAVPTCGCMIGRATAYESKRVEAFDVWVSGVGDLLHQYIPKISNEVAIIDKVEAEAKYGESSNDPGVRQQLYIMQRQAMGSVTAVISYASGTWEDAGKAYSNQVNASSGASVGCNGRK